MKTRLGWLGPVLLAVGVAVGIVATWWMIRARPEPGQVIDRIELGGEWSVVVRAEASSDRAFVQLISSKTGEQWEALVPRYGGRPGASGIGSSAAAISVRIIRGGRPEVWALSTRDAKKLGGISLAPYAAGDVIEGASNVVTFGDGTRSFEVVDGTAGATIVAIDLDRGSVLWKRAVGAPIDALAAEAGRLRIVPRGAPAIVVDALTGADATER